MFTKLWAYRLFRFSLVGVINTLTDLCVLNILVFGFEIMPIVANIISTTVGISLSYFWNRRLVFIDDSPFRAKVFMRFIAVTALGLLVVQTVTIFFFERFITVQMINQLMNIDSDQARFLQVNSAKIVAIIGSLLWNYALYSKVIFRKVY